MMKKSKRAGQGSAASRRKRVFGAGACACVLLGAGVVTAVAGYGSRTGAAPAPPPPAATAAPKSGYVTVEVGGRKLRVNAQTLQQGPLTQEQSEQIADALKDNKSTEGLVEVRHEDGSVSMDLQGRFQSVTLAKRNDDGTVSTACVDTPEAARSFLSRSEAAPKTTAGTGATGKAALRK
ncbi:MAG TPA: hypothetical protein VF659_12565 [Pyrinomonadaceae bacterium]|jgi:hypothetical protein